MNPEDKKINEYLKFTPGTQVKFKQDCCPNFGKDKVYTISHGPQYMCGEYVFWSDDLSGAYACNAFEIVK